jgi:hypothetical protein
VSPTKAVVGPSERLRAEIGLVLPELVNASRRLATHPRLRELYPEFLFTTHAVIRASVPLMETAMVRAEALAAADPVAAALARYLAGHIDEERDHDEWLLDDMAILGYERASILARPPSATVAALVGAQYYWIHHFHPVGLLGYIAVLEGYPPAPELLKEMAELSGYPRAAFRTLAAHAELDPGHSEELDLALDALPLTREQSEVVGVSAIVTVRALARAFDEAGRAP